MLTAICRFLVTVSCLLLIGGCTNRISPTSEKRQEAAVQPTLTVTPRATLDKQGYVYTCARQLYDTQLWQRFGSFSVQSRMISEHQVEIASWTTRSVRTAVEQNLPTPTPVLGMYHSLYPTDYIIYQYDLTTNVFTRTVQNLVPFRDSYCRSINAPCEQQVLSNSPDNQWQLVAVTSALGNSRLGIWLVNKDFYERLIAPFDSDVFNNSYAQAGEAWWRWQADSTGLFLTYHLTMGETPYLPMFIHLRRPPAYAFLWEGVHMYPSSADYLAFPVDQQTILLDVSGAIVQADGSIVYQQWHVFDTTTGAMRQAQADDFATYAQYVFFDNEDSLMLVEWTPDKQKQWVAAHPDADIWNILGDNTLFSQPYQTGGGTFLIPTSSSYDESLEITECTPQQ